MEFRVEAMDRILLLGKAERQFIGKVQANIFWETCEHDGTLSQLTAQSASTDKELIGIADSSSYDGKSYLYYIATPFDSKIVPEGFTAINLPAALWIKFKCSSYVPDSAGKDIWTYIYSEFFPASEYEPSEYQLEVYPCRDGSYPENMSEIWVSVKCRYSFS